MVILLLLSSGIAATVVVVGFIILLSSMSIIGDSFLLLPSTNLEQITLNQSQQNLSSNVAELQTEIIRLRNQLEPRNISEAFPLYPLSSVDVPNNTYSEMKEGTIAGLGNRNSSPKIVK